MHVSPFCQCLTFRDGAADALDHRLAGVGGLERLLELALHAEAGHGQRLFEALSERRGCAGMGAVELWCPNVE
jgi:hypothetical protein